MKDDTGSLDAPADTPIFTTWYTGTYDTHTVEILLMRTVEPAASTVTENTWTVSHDRVDTAYELVLAVDVATQTFTSTLVTDDGTMLVSGSYDAGADGLWTAWHSTSVYQNGTYEGTRVESSDHLFYPGIDRADKTVYDADGTATHYIVEQLGETYDWYFYERLDDIGA